MSVEIHPMAVVDPAARLGENVSIGPFCSVGPQVELGDGVRLVSHVAIAGRTSVGAGTVVYPFAALGHAPQDLKYRGEDTALVIGANNVIRESVTIHVGTAHGRGITTVGDNGLFMANTHIAHDCIVGNHVIMANCATLGGHVVLGDYVFLSGLVGVHQFVRIGEHAFVGGVARVERDVIPFGMVLDEMGALTGLNLVGLKRRGFQRSDIHLLRAAYRRLFHGGGEMADRLKELEREHGGVPVIRQLLDYIEEQGPRKILLPRGSAADFDDDGA